MKNTTTSHRRSNHRHSAKSIRTRVMQHVVGFIALFSFFMLSIFFESGKGGTLSDWTVIFYVVVSFFAYGFGFYAYLIVRRAWLESKR